MAGGVGDDEGEERGAGAVAEVLEEKAIGEEEGERGEKVRVM